MSNYVNKTDGKFNHGKWIRENMSVMKNQDILLLLISFL